MNTFWVLAMNHISENRTVTIDKLFRFFSFKLKNRKKKKHLRHALPHPYSDLCIKDFTSMKTNIELDTSDSTKNDLDTYSI